jgi:hypothetical protein
MGWRRCHRKIRRSRRRGLYRGRRDAHGPHKRSDRVSGKQEPPHLHRFPPIAAQEIPRVVFRLPLCFVQELVILFDSCLWLFCIHVARILCIHPLAHNILLNCMYSSWARTNRKSPFPRRVVSASSPFRVRVCFQPRNPSLREIYFLQVRTTTMGNFSISVLPLQDRDLVRNILSAKTLPNAL